MHFPHVLVLQPSPACVAAIATLHLGVAIVYLLATAWPWWLLATPVLVFSLCRSIRSERARKGMRLWLEDDGYLVIESDEQSEAVLLQAVDFAGAVWMTWSECDLPHGKRASRSLMLLPDGLSVGSWRILRIWLRHKAIIARRATNGGSGAV